MRANGSGGGGLMKITWIDGGREPRCPADPAYPDGVDLDLSISHEPACRVLLPYPTQRCGLYAVTCGTCGRSIVATAAGRRDDPRSVTFACGRRR
jgi:hypothetical protein